jgi:hypothetical protein
MDTVRCSSSLPSGMRWWMTLPGVLPSTISSASNRELSPQLWQVLVLRLLRRSHTPRALLFLKHSISQPRINLIWHRGLRERRPISTQLVTCAWHSEVRYSIRILHHVDQGASAHVPGDMAVEGSDPGAARAHLPHHIPTGW